MEKIFFYVKKYLYFIIIIVISLIILFSLLFKETKEEINIENSVNEQEIKIENSESVIEQIKTVKFDIKGAVKKPGVYEIEENSTVNDAIIKSGGLLDEADTSVINLSKSVTNEMVIIVYTKKEIAEMRKGTTTVKYIEKECICPQIENNACIDNSDDSLTDSKISLNNASLEQLMSLSGIGEAKAKLIIEYRNTNGGFKSIEEIVNVKGISNTIYEKIKDYITL